MNPLNLPGPAFLIFYATLASAVLLALFLARRISEAGQLPVLNDKDPFLLACLRGGPREVVRVATVGLIDRGLLKMTDTAVTAASGGRAQFGDTRVERDVMHHFRNSAAFATVFDGQAVISAGAYETTLSRLRLIPDDDITRFRQTCRIIALAVLLAVGCTKLVMAWTQGRSTVWFLIGLMVVSVIAAWKLSSGYRTVTGDRYLASIRSLFTGLRDRASSLRPGSGTRELLWLTALFGVAAIPVSTYPFAKYFKRSGNSGSSCSGGSCGSSSGGSSCGGGGGGCGGCGGGGD
ncbi:MAG: hypothetical protein JWN71_1012 [Xanthobacteraceae bacterium]|nr:hypothetical protein [Xanthobacteraceae bacterium]